MSYAPASIIAAREYVHQRTGLPYNALGIVGDAAHGNEGYHVGWDRLQYGEGRGDYSVSDSVRDSNPSNAASAFDVGAFGSLQAFSVWLVTQCRAGAADTQDIREVIYSPDGYSVKRWDRLGNNVGGDDSHLFHTHISYFRDSEFNDKTAMFRRYFEGDVDVTPAQAYQLQILLSNWDPDRAQYVKAGGSGATWDAAQASGGARNGVKQALNSIELSIADLKTKISTPAPPPTIDYVKLAAELIKQLKA